MKKEEVIEWLTIIKANLNSFPEVSNTKKIEALGEAIRFIKNEQSEEPSSSKKPNKSEIPTSSITKNDVGVDCIDRKEFIDWINVWDITPIIKRPLIRHVQGMPSVKTIRPKGYWRIVDTDMYACSKCSHVLTIDPLDNSILEMNTCPFCSAYMEWVE